MEDERQMANDKQRAEVFDALGHPTRILILKALNDGALGFSDLKKKTAIESSGHLQHHLTKLNGLIKTDEYGKYCLSDQGRDALLTVKTVENASPKTRLEEKARKRLFSGRIGVKAVVFLMAALIVASSAVAIYEYNQIVGLQRQTSFFNGLNSGASAYYSQFGAIVPVTNTSSVFAPPISMYQALMIGLEADGWNKTSIQGFTVYINLMPWETYTNSTFGTGGGVPSNMVFNGMLTTPPASYTDFNINGVIYRYVWQIDIQKGSGISIPPWDLILIDASTGQIVPNPILI